MGDDGEGEGGGSGSGEQRDGAGEAGDVDAVAEVAGVYVVRTAAERIEGDSGESGGIGALQDLAERDGGARAIGVGADEVGVAIVVVVSGVDGVGEGEVADGRLGIGLEGAVAIAEIDERAVAAAGDDVGFAVAVDVGEVRIGRDVG